MFRIWDTFWRYTRSSFFTLRFCSVLIGFSKVKLKFLSLFGLSKTVSQQQFIVPSFSPAYASNNYFASLTSPWWI